MTVNEYRSIKNKLEFLEDTIADLTSIASKFKSNDEEEEFIEYNLLLVINELKCQAVRLKLVLDKGFGEGIMSEKDCSDYVASENNT